MLSSEWQPIESAPKDGTRVLLYTDTHLLPRDGYYDQLTRDGLHFAVVQVGRYGNDDWRAEFCGHPTHWMPLPEPPAGDAS